MISFPRLQLTSFAYETKKLIMAYFDSSHTAEF
jgi:hypothetical protein